MNTVTVMNTNVESVKTVADAPTFFASPVAANEDYSDVRMTLTDLIEFVGLEERRDSIIRRMNALVKNNVIREPQIVKSEKINNLGLAYTHKDYVFVGKQGRKDSIVLVVRSGKGDKAAELVERWDYLENELLNKEDDSQYELTEIEWIRKALALAEEKNRLLQEKKQLVELHIRKSVDAHSMTRLLGEKRGSLLVQKALNALREAGYIERVYDDSNKPKGYIANDNSLTFCRMNAHFQLEFTVDVLPVLINLGVLEEEQKETLRLPQPNNTLLIQNKAAQKIRESASALTLECFGI
ncbi:hypothetical protein [Salmonella enterica]|uniref:hypothetical protein n=1 Tax=Salmonella enterica TaxID=28901 RepID=UPI000D582A7B|nr:hypothetical protein [Salmonella enterica]PVO50905.1 hypothetical protein C4743_06190 [Salmonella enterica subsp. enterica serovar Newport]